MLESSFSVRDSGAFLFVSPLEPSLPWELCRPGNKQSFVSTVPSSQTANLHSCANRKPQKRNSAAADEGEFFSHPPVLSSSPIKTSTARKSAVVLW